MRPFCAYWIRNLKSEGFGKLIGRMLNASYADPEARGEIFGDNSLYPSSKLSAVNAGLFHQFQTDLLPPIPLTCAPFFGLVP